MFSSLAVPTIVIFPFTSTTFVVEVSLSSGVAITIAGDAKSTFIEALSESVFPEPSFTVNDKEGVPVAFELISIGPTM